MSATPTTIALADIRERVIESLAEAELSRRTEILSSALRKSDDLAGELKKIKPSHSLGVNPETGKEDVRFSKADFEKQKKASEKLEKLNKAIDAVIDSPSGETYGKLKDVVAKS